MIHEEEIKQPVKINAILATFTQNKKRSATSELAATVDEVSKVIPLTKRYGFGFWLKLVKKSGVSYTEMFGILKEVRGVGNDKTGKPYNKAGILVNKLKKLCLNKQSIPSSLQNSTPKVRQLSGKKRVSKQLKSKTAKSSVSPQTETLW